MKKIFCLGSLLAMIFFAAGCSKTIPAAGDEMLTRVLYADAAAVKTTLEGCSLLWEEDDELCCIATYEEAERWALYSGITPLGISGASAKFEVTFGSAYTPAYLVYPASEEITFDYSQGNISVPLPSSYTTVRNGLPVKSNVSAGVINGDQVLMKNVMSLVKFEITTETIARIDISSIGGEALSGTLTFDPLSTAAPSSSGSGKLSILPPEEESVFLPGIYYFPLPPISLSKGLKFSFTDADGLIAVKTYGEKLDLVRNHILNIGKESEWALVFQSTTRTLTALVHDGTALVNSGWPFLGTRPKIGTVCGQGLVGPFYLSENEDAPFYFYVAANINSDSWRSTNGAGFRFGGTAHDYMLMPPIDGYRLVSLQIFSGGKEAQYAVTNNPAQGTPVPLSGGAAVTIKANSNHLFQLEGTEPGVAYRLDLPAGTCSSMYKFVLVYNKSSE